LGATSPREAHLARVAWTPLATCMHVIGKAESDSAALPAADAEAAFAQRLATPSSGGAQTQLSPAALDSRFVLPQTSVVYEPYRRFASPTLRLIGKFLSAKVRQGCFAPRFQQITDVSWKCVDVAIASV
jgi:hypothetical protein